MKNILHYGAALLLVAMLGCQKEEVSTTTQIANAKQVAMVMGTESLAKAVVDFSDNLPIAHEIFDAVTTNMNDGRDEIIAFEDLSKHSPLLTALQHKTQNSDLATFLVAHNLEIYWPYSINWDKQTTPTITFKPLTSLSENMGFVKEGDGFRQVLVNEAYAEKHPVWIIEEKQDVPEGFKASKQSPNTKMAAVPTQIYKGVVHVEAIALHKSEMDVDYEGFLLFQGSTSRNMKITRTNVAIKYDPKTGLPLDPIKTYNPITVNGSNLFPFPKSYWGKWYPVDIQFGSIYENANNKDYITCFMAGKGTLNINVVAEGRFPKNSIDWLSTIFETFIKPFFGGTPGIFITYNQGEYYHWTLKETRYDNAFEIFKKPFFDNYFYQTITDPKHTVSNANAATTPVTPANLKKYTRFNWGRMDIITSIRSI